MTPVLLVLACASSDPVPAPAPPAGPQPPAVEASPSLPARTAPAGPLWVQTEAALIRLDDTGGRAVRGLPGPTDAWVLDPQGAPVVAVGGQVFRVDGLDAVALGPPADDLFPIGIDGLAVAPDGTTWAAGPMGVASLRDGAWTAAEAAGFRPAAAEIADVAVGPDGAVMVRGRAGLWRQDPGGFVYDDLTATFPGLEFVDDLTITPDGIVWLAVLGEGAPSVIARREGAWTADDRRLSFGVDGRALAVDADGGLVHVDREDGRVVRGEQSLDLREAGAVALGVEAITVDRRNRVWAATRQGLLVWDEAGTVTEYARGRNGLPTEPIVALSAAAGGPELGPPVAVVQAVGGRLLRGEAPVEGAPVALCGDYDLLYEGHPCRADTARYEATTDAAGRFELAAVPQGSYSFLARLDGEWTVVLGALCCRDMPADGPVALGDIVLSD
ncbi:MAG: hypothetical protein H6742_19640 [Alphaproteobacteria bacterium]|nr:hypothetical protein [Alphaproteobacteria bacterium]